MDFQWVIDLGNAVLSWFSDETNQSLANSLVAAATFALTVLGLLGTGLWFVLTRLFRKSPPPPLEIPQAAPALPTGDVLSMDQHLTLLDKREAKLKADLAAAHGAELALLQAQIAELQKRRENPETSLKEAQARIRDLEDLLERDSNEIGRERITKARAALEEGDYSLADEIFADLRARNELAVETYARAAFGQGEVAEAEIRWADAAKHYARAADLVPNLDNLAKATRYAELAADYRNAQRYAEAMVTLARQETNRERLAFALDRQASAMKLQGQFSKAETLFREAMSVTEELDGKAAEAYAARLNNLAGVVVAQGRYAEAVELYRAALDIGRGTIGEAHPAYATCLNNLAGVLQAQGRYEEAEEYYRAALEIDRATIGEAHPDYATRLNNLALAVEAQGRYEEAEEHYRAALEIDLATLGEAHPDYAIDLHNLASVVEAQGRYAEAEDFYRAALEIDRATIGEAHPDYAIHLGNLGDLLGNQMGQVAEGREMLIKALAIFTATLPPDHPSIVNTQAKLDALPPG